MRHQTLNRHSATVVDDNDNDIGQDDTRLWKWAIFSDYRYAVQRHHHCIVVVV